MMKRRHFLHSIAAAGAAGGTAARGADPATPPFPRAYSQDGHRLRVTCPQVAAPFHLCFIADTHLFRDDDRGEAYRQFSARMAGAYHRNKHFITGDEITPEQGFTGALQAAAEMKASQVILGGDILSFPSEAAVEWTLAELRRVGIPWQFTAGNHDWHYEGMPGSSAELRDTWCRSRLSPLYQGADPLMSVREVHGVRLVMIDDSTYEIQPSQLEFMRREIATGKPVLLFLHIPLYAPGRGVGFGCGHPGWGAKSDRGHEVEKRPLWRKDGHTRTTFDFHREVTAASNVVGIFAGHTHSLSTDVIGGIPQCVTAANANGGYLQIQVVPS